MKKTLFLCAILLTIVIAGCNEENLFANIIGLWRVQKYAVDGVDRTRWFDSAYVNFSWEFAKGDKNAFRKVWTVRDTRNIISYDTTKHVDTMTQLVVIDRIDTLHFIEPRAYQDTVVGDWYLTNSNKFMVTRDPRYGNIEYQIIDHSTGSLHLIKGNEEYYLTQ